MNKFDEFYKARDLVADILRKDMVGPVKDDETLRELPTQYYMLGKLYPQQTISTDAESAEEDARALAEFVPEYEPEAPSGGLDEVLALSNAYLPSSLGLTFVLKESAQAMVTVDYALYKPQQREKHSKEHPTWQRDSFHKKFALSGKGESQRINLTDEASLYIYRHPNPVLEGSLWTVSLLNRQMTSGQVTADAAKIMFQSRIYVSAQPGDFREVTQSTKAYQGGGEPLELSLLYRKKLSFAQGHGCSCDWDRKHQEPAWVTTEVMPQHDVLQMQAADSKLPIFEIQRLADGESQNLQELDKFAQEYEAWIIKQEKRLGDLTYQLRPAGAANLEKCHAMAARLQRGIDSLRESCNGDGLAWQAFCMANEVMLMVRQQTVRKRGGMPGTIRWFPFQLAFFLGEIDSFIHPDGQDRQAVDLLWFPTGGGKTEAYLGLAAFVIFLRRLRNSEADGVTILMRYTLRLLTLQQFERASMLITAAEHVRRKHHLGGSEISIGMWVGESLTDNRFDGVKTKMAQHDMPVPLTACPWCGQRLDIESCELHEENSRLEIHCPNEKCLTHSWEHGLPLHMIDEQIYAYLPTFVVATVDKFAQVPLQASNHVLFGRTGHGYKKPPELIIQDELHLLSGPLGTIVGLYETAIDKLCEDEHGHPVKVVASTATIRNAEAQIRALYGRPHTQFPPQGLDEGDSFFAVTASPEAKPSRRYIGIMGIGSAQAMTFIRLNGALMFASRYLQSQSFSPEIVDHFWTITNYFNTLRELGGAATQVLDEVQSRYEYLSKTKFAQIYPLAEDLNNIRYDNAIEITSRLDNREVGKSLQQLERSYDPAHPNDACSFVLATNMISVGVDVSRLGLMVVSGQPKTNAEYIQATSRVGRSHPGLVLTIYNPMRSRDKSHYEQFLHYHMALYRYVEATSLTPFSDRARDRALHAVLFTMCRYFIDALHEDKQAGNITKSEVQRQVNAMKQAILERVRRVDASEVEVTSEELDAIVKEWQAKASDMLCYRNDKHGTRLLAKDTDLEESFRMMNSMRNVDGQSGICLCEGGEA